MEVQMLYALARVRAHIGDHTIAGFGHAQFLAQTGNHRVNVTQQRCVLLRQVRRGADMLFGNDQKMHRGLRIDVVEGQQSIILKQLAGRDLPCRDFAEQAIIYLRSLL